MVAAKTTPTPSVAALPHVSDDREAGCSIHVASTPDEYASAFRTAYDVYHPLGYTPHSPLRMRVTQYHLLPTTIVFLARHRGQTVGTMSLFSDEVHGLPSASGWADDLDALRARRRRIFECGALMIRPGAVPDGRRVCLDLFRHAWLYARLMRGADALCAFVQKRHQNFYKLMMNFKSFGEPQFYHWGRLRIPEVVPLWMDLDDAEAEFRARFDRWGNSPRNLYRFFVIQGIAEAAPRLQADLARRARMDWRALRARFEPLCPAPSAEAVKSERA